MKMHRYAFILASITAPAIAEARIPLINATDLY